MLIGCIIITVSHFTMALPFINTSWFALGVMILVGIAFSMVPSIMWPSVPKLVPLRQLGTAYSIIYYIQNLGLMLVPVWVGNIIDENTNPATGHVDYLTPMLVFAGLGIAASVVALRLFMDKRKHYGLQKANIVVK